MDWLNRQAKESIDRAVRSRGSAVLIGGAVDLAPVDAVFVDLGQAMIDAMKAQAELAGASWAVVLEAQENSGSQHRDKLSILQSRAMRSLFSDLRSLPSGIVLVGLDVAQEWGISESAVTAYLSELNDRTFDRSNQNQYIFAESSHRFQDRTIAVVEVPEALAANPLAEFNQFAAQTRLSEEAKSTFFDLECDKQIALQDKARIRLESIDQNILDLQLAILSKLDPKSESQLRSGLSLRSKGGNPTKKALKSALFALQGINDCFRADSAKPTLLEWYQSRNTVSSHEITNPFRS